MTNDLKEKVDSDNPAQDSSDDKLNEQDEVDDEFTKLTSPEHMEKEGESRGSSKPVDLDSAEDAATDDDTKTEEGSGSGLYAPDTGPRRAKLWSSSDKGKGALRLKRRMIGGGVMLGIAGALLVVMMSFVTPALELFHLKEVLTQRVGEVQSLVVKNRSGKLYSRAFFFDEDGFDGYKSRGSLFSIYDNYKTTNLLNNMRAVDPSFSIDYNGKTGRINSISWTEDGVVKSVDTPTGFKGLWESHGAIRNALEKAYPDKSSFWRSRASRKLYARAGISYTLSNWVENTRLVKAVDDLAEKLGRKLLPKEKITAKMRQALFGDIFDSPDPRIRVSVKENAEATEAQNQSNDIADGIADDIADDSNRLVGDLLDDPAAKAPRPATGLLTPLISDLSGDAAKKISASVAKAGAAAGITGTIVNITDRVCRVKYMLDIVEIGAREIRSSKLSENFAQFSSIADSGKAGDASSETINGLVQRVHTVDENGKGFYSGGGYNYVSGGEGIVDPVNQDQFSVGGGSVATYSAINAFMDRGGGWVTASCGLATNIGFQVAVGAGEFVATVIAPCVLTAGLGCPASVGKIGASIAGGVGTEVAFQGVMLVLRPILVRLAAGVVVDQLEVGPEMSDALVSGASAWFGRRSSSAGMRPLSSKLFAQLESDAREEKQRYYAQQSFFDKYLNPTNTESLMFASLMKIPQDITKTLATMKNITIGFNPVGLLSSTFYDAASGTAFAAVGNASEQCTDPAIINLDIATDPFCNPIYGEDLAALDKIDPLDNTLWMIDNGYVAPDVSASGEVVYCNTPPSSGASCSKDYEDYVNQCFLNTTPLRREKGGIEEKCFSSEDKYQRFRAFRLDRDLSVMTADSINKDFDY